VCVCVGVFECVCVWVCVCVCLCVCVCTSIVHGWDRAAIVCISPMCANVGYVCGCTCTRVGGCDKDTEIARK
jgi:hypothetical protein